MTHRVSRREALAALGLATLTSAFRWTPADVERAAAAARAAGYEPKFFTPHEWETLRVLVDLIIPRDERSGSATDAGVPEFIDFMLMERVDAQRPMRGGLAWLDAQSRQRFGSPFVGAAEARRAELLDAIAWPARARPEHSHGVAFFTMVRDLTASGFWSSKMGVEDLRYQGNAFVTEWRGCPDAALRKLGVRYD
jgi:hypothetical protein